jgi:hypothetical protein
MLGPGSDMEKIRIRDPGWKKFEVGSGIRHKYPGSATSLDKIAARNRYSVAGNIRIIISIRYE